MTFNKLFSPDVQENLRDALVKRNASLDAQLKNQPTEVTYCTKCVVSNQRPRMTFDENGVCSACQFAEHKRSGIDWNARGEELAVLLDQYRSKDGNYDVVVPGSGGKDSATVAHKLKHEFGMHPLTVTWAPFIYTDIGFKNFYDFIQSGFDNLMCWPNGIIHRKLARLGFDLLGDAWHPFGYGQLNYAFQIASKFDIKLVFFGENGEAEYGGSSSSNDKSSFDWDDWAEVYLKGALVDNLAEKGVELGVFTPDELTEVSDFYRLPPVEELKEKDIQFHWFSYYNKWTPQENYYYARENTGFEANPAGRSEGTYSKYASLDDRTDGFHFYLAYAKFGIARATSDAAHEVRDQHITREEAIALVKRYDGEFPAKYFKEFIEYLDISEEDFNKVIDSYRAPHLWDKVDGEWQVKNAVWRESSE